MSSSYVRPDRSDANNAAERFRSASGRTSNVRSHLRRNCSSANQKGTIVPTDSCHCDRREWSSTKSDVCHNARSDAILTCACSCRLFKLTYSTTCRVNKAYSSITCLPSSLALSILSLFFIYILTKNSRCSGNVSNQVPLATGRRLGGGPSVISTRKKSSSPKRPASTKKPRA